MTDDPDDQPRRLVTDLNTAEAIAEHAHAAARLIAAVHADDAEETLNALADATAQTGDMFLGAAALAVVLAAAVPDDIGLDDLLAWTRDRHTYQTLRAAGWPHGQAAAYLLVAGELAAADEPLPSPSPSSAEPYSAGSHPSHPAHSPPRLTVVRQA